MNGLELPAYDRNRVRCETFNNTGFDGHAR